MIQIWSENDRHSRQSPTVEKARDYVITGILFPCDEEQPIKRVEVDAENIETIQGIVGGTFEAFNFDNPPASILANDEAMLWSLPYNLRATVLLWQHAKGLRGRVYISGDAILTGAPSRSGRTKSVPPQLIELLCETEKYGVEFLHHPDGPWSRKAVEFTDWLEAYNYAIIHEETFATVRSARVIGA
ncbi:hypothetical protein QF026_004814 [Streptomyces aurantiacus]|uniref:DUF3846 domain-containing protein n=1 Tax=Streptomyces aurantiacus TaxID=47760 RepID=UPI002793C48B|nr:DUF3846 domain-containing protein [Streptomyces aurantiacus]MDQ0776348.1 hypothetical protein [Streptomyces aurantiacus]